MNTEQEKGTWRNSSLPLYELDLSFRAYRCLTNAGIRTVAELTQMTPADLLSIKKLNLKTLEEIEETLDGIGWSLARNGGHEKKKKS